MFEDKYIKCAEQGCSQVRLFSAGEQEFFADKGYKDPKYCKDHSTARKQQNENRKNSPFKPVLDQMRKDPRYKDSTNQ